MLASSSLSLFMDHTIMPHPQKPLPHHHRHHHRRRHQNSKPMKIHNSLALTILLLAISITLHRSHAKQTEPLTGILRIHQWLSLETETIDAKLQFTPSLAMAGLLCFLAASISSAGGIGGGGLFIPILTIVAGFDLKTASTFSAFMVTGGSLSNIICSIFFAKPRCGGKTVIDFDIALLSQPCLLLGVSIGVICNVVFPEWLITILFAVFLAWCSFKTCRSGVLFWLMETEEAEAEEARYRCGLLENGGGGEVLKGVKQPLLSSGDGKCAFPWMKLGILIMIWFSFFILYLLRGNKYGQNILPIKPCGVAYWIVSSVKIPVAIIFTAWILYSRKQRLEDLDSIPEETEENVRLTNIMFPVMALLAGLLGGVFGIGGGMLISPLLMQLGVAPEVTAATCSFMVFFSSTMSAIQYLLLGMEHTGEALIFSVLCFLGSVIGLVVVQRAIGKHGRASIIVFSVGIVMVLSTVLITSFGALDVWLDYRSGKYMGFKLPC